MERLFIVASILLVASALTDVEKWQQYKIAHGKSYQSLVEEQTRFALFSENLRKIENHNHKFENSETTFKMGTTKFSDWTDSEINNFLKSFDLTEFPEGARSGCKKTRLGIKPPKSFDWRLKNVITEVKEQGACGSGWAFAAAGCLETTLYYFSAQHLRSVSAQALIDCFAPTKNGGKDGCSPYNGTIKDVYDYMIEKGFAFESDYPYSSGNGKAGECQITKFSDHLREYTLIPKGDENYLQQVISFESPTAVQIDGSPLLNYESGIIDAKVPCSKDVPNHAAIIVGYGSENGTDFWILKNSWGKAWGENGYFRLERGFNVCGVATAAIEPVYRC